MSVTWPHPPPIVSRLVHDIGNCVSASDMSGPVPSITVSQQKAIDAGKLIETTNALSIHEFCERYCNLSDLNELTVEIETLLGREVIVGLMWARDLEIARMDVLNACLDLIEASSAYDYKNAGMKWSLASKRKEMLLPDMKYLIIQERSIRTGTNDDYFSPVYGFVSYMITYEDGHEVVYIYEIHLQPEFCGLGIGKVLLGMVEEIGRKIKVEKAMLTVFKSNKRAVKWYHRIGYSVDDFSPQPRIMRNGTIKEPKYIILSKSLR